MKNRIIVHNKNFDLKQIAESGQCFRMTKMEENKYCLIAYEKYLELKQLEEDQIELCCSREQFNQVWEDYFDLNYDYDAVVQNLINGSDRFLCDAAEFGKGIRILRQEPFEMMISYIISQNKNIPAIKNCIEAICRQYGEKKLHSDTNTVYYTFPTPETLASAQKEELRSLKTGYRDEYIIKASEAVINGEIDLSYLKNCNYEDAIRILKSVHGIGEKVANCICLYGLHHIDVFPIDVWIARIIKEVYQNNFNPQIYTGYAGIVQQYMFYYIRNVKQEKKRE